MAEERKSITLYIGQQPFKLSVSADDEELYHRAENKIQDYMRRLAEKSNINDRFILLGYAAVHFAVNTVNLTDKQKFIDSDLKNNLRKIQEVIDLVLQETQD